MCPQFPTLLPPLTMLSPLPRHVYISQQFAFFLFTQIAFFFDLYKIRKIFEQCLPNPASIVAPRWHLFCSSSSSEPRPNSYALCSQESRRESSVYLSVHVSSRYTDGNSQQPWPLTRQPSIAVCVGEGEATGEGEGRGEGGQQARPFYKQQQQPPPPNSALLLATDSSLLGVGSAEMKIQKHTERNCRYIYIYFNLLRI